MTTGTQREDTAHRSEFHEKIHGQDCFQFALCSKCEAIGKKIITPGIRRGCRITVQIIPFNWKCPCKEKNSLNIFKEHWNIPIFLPFLRANVQKII